MGYDKFYNFIVDKDKIRRIYELEYKISSLERLPHLSDRQYLYLSKWKSEANRLADELLGFLYKVLSEWYEWHYDYLIKYDGTYDNMFLYLNTMIKTLNNVADALELIKKAQSPSASLKDKFLAINIALQLEHINGDMFVIGDNDRFVSEVPNDYFSPYEVNQFLNDMSAADVSEWDTDLRELGVLAKSACFNWYRCALLGKRLMPEC